MKSSSNKNFSITKLDKSHQRPSFCCGADVLDHYLHKQASQESRKSTSVTYILNDNIINKIAGYYTLSATVIELTELPENFSRKLPYYPLLPATLIGRLTVDVTYQKQGLGEIILLDALHRSYQTSQNIASIAVVVDAIDSDAVKFYKKYGFTSLTSRTNKLYLSMHAIEILTI